MSEESPQEEVTRELRYKYTKADYHRVILAHGARGSLTPRGEVVFDLFTEIQLFPESEEEKQEQQNVIVLERQEQVKVIMSVSDAAALGKFLQDKLKDFEHYVRQKEKASGEQEA